MHVYTIIAAATGEAGTANYPYILGLVAIAISLVAIFRVSALRQELLKTASPAAHQPTAAAKAAVPAQPSAAEGIPPELVAVIAAAVATVAGNNRRIVSIKPMSSSWEKAGRQSVLTSHRIR